MPALFASQQVCRCEKEEKYQGLMLLFCCLVVSLFCCFVVLLIFYICTVSHFIPLLREERVVVGSSFVSFSIKMRLFHINSHISSGFLLKNKISKCNSTLPPRCCYHCDNQWIMRGGITGGIRVELHVIPPIFHL